MGHIFPGQDWLEALEQILNTDPQYGRVAKDWEGAILVHIQLEQDHPSGRNEMTFYLDLWHGTCRQARMLEPGETPLPEAKFVLSASRARMLDILEGRLDPIQAMVTRRFKVEGPMAYMLRNVPVVLDFIRCCRLVETDPGVG